MKTYIKYILSGLFLFSPLLFCSGCSSTSTKNTPVSDTGFFFDTVVNITLYNTKDTSLIEECFSLMKKYEDLLSRTRENSDIWKINHSEGKPVEVSEDTIFLLQTALHYAQLSDGAFDISIAPVTDLWDFKNEAETAVPDETRIKEALSHVNYKNITITDRTVTLLDPKAAIDLGGIAKGYIADRLKAFLVSQGITSGLIDLGGNLLTIGSKPDGSDWKMGVRKPFAETASQLSATVTFSDASLVTSGTYERYFKKDGILYHHLLDPATGVPASTGLTSVSILASSSTDCDALSTTCFLLGLKDGMALIETLPDTEALFISEDGSLHRSSGFPTE